MRLMKSQNSHRCFFPVTLTCFALLAALDAAGETRYWDGGSTDILSNGDGVSAGGAGTWNTSTLNWDAGTSPHVSWTNANGDTAVFGGVAGTVTLGTGITVGGIQFINNSFIIASSTLTLEAGAILSVSNNFSATISSALTGATDLNKAGTGKLTLSGSLSYTGNTYVTAGQLDLASVSLGGFGGGAGRNISVSVGAAVRRNAIDNAFLNRLVESTN